MMISRLFNALREKLVIVEMMLSTAYWVVLKTKYSVRIKLNGDDQ